MILPDTLPNDPGTVDTIKCVTVKPAVEWAPSMFHSFGPSTGCGGGPCGAGAAAGAGGGACA